MSTFCGELHAYLEKLVAAPHKLVPALELTGDSGPIADAESRYQPDKELDATAISNLRNERRRLGDEVAGLQTEIEEIKRANDPSRDKQLHCQLQIKRDELEQIEKQLRTCRIVDRKPVSRSFQAYPADKARQRVRKALDRAIKKLTMTMPLLAACVAKTIDANRTSFVYRPAP